MLAEFAPLIDGRRLHDADAGVFAWYAYVGTITRAVIAMPAKRQRATKTITLFRTIAERIALVDGLDAGIPWRRSKDHGGPGINL